MTQFSHLGLWVEGFLEVEGPFHADELREHAEFEVVFHRWGFSSRVVARVEEMIQNEKLSYRQVSGLFKTWLHTQILKPHSANTTLLTDLVEFRLPMGIAGALVDDLLVRREIERIFNVRLARIEEFFATRESRGNG